MTQNGPTNNLETLQASLKQLEQQPLPVTTRAAVSEARKFLDQFSVEIAENQEQSRLAALYQVSHVLGSSLDLQQVLDQVMDAVIGLTGAERGFLVLVDEDMVDWKLQAARNFSQETLEAKDMEVSRTVIATVIKNCKGVVTTDAQTDPRFFDQESVVYYSLSSIMCAPILARNQVIGVIYVDNRVQIDLFTQSDLELLSAFAAQAAIAIENARLYTRTDQALNRRVAELEELAQIDRELNAHLDLERVLEITRGWGVQGVGAETCQILLIEPEEKKSIFDGGPSEPFSMAKFEIQAQEMAGAPPEGVYRKIVPVIHSGKPLAVLVVDRSTPFAVESDVFLSRLSNRAAAAIENARLYQAVQHANHEKTKFVSVVTHELRIPMTSIKGYAELLKVGAVGDLNEQQQGFVQIIRNNVDRMSALVSDLSDISRIETGRLNLESRSVSVQKSIEEVVSSLRPRIEEKNQTYEVLTQTNLPAAIADPNRVIQILSNLINNASKYTPAGGRIQISASTSNEWVRVEIADNGIGIKSEDQARLFSQFFRSEDQAVRDQQGWGLGLNVSRRLVELMKGEIGMQSEYGEGSTFWFTLPVFQG